MERSIHVRLTLAYEPRFLRPWLTAGMLLLAVGELNSESVTLTTYYPAPSGVYTRMITTGDTYLARNSGAVVVNSAGVVPVPNGPRLGVNGAVGIGTYWNTVPPANGLLVSGSVGIGTTSPQTPAPNGLNGNMDVNDVWVRGANKWVSQSPTLNTWVSANQYDTDQGPQTHRTRHWDCPPGSAITKIWERQRQDKDWWGHILGVDCRKLQ